MLFYLSTLFVSGRFEIYKFNKITKKKNEYVLQYISYISVQCENKFPNINYLFEREKDRIIFL